MCLWLPCRWEQAHSGGNSPAPLGEMSVAVSPKGTVYVAGASVLCSSLPNVCVHGDRAELHTLEVCRILRCCRAAAIATATAAAGDGAGGYSTAAYTALRPGGFRSLLRSAYSAEVFEFR